MGTINQNVGMPLAEVQATTDVLTLKIREAVPADLPFILDTYMRSRCSAEHSNNRRKAFASARKTFLELATRGSRLLVACDDVEPALILGWALVEGSILHFVYVKNMFRHQGVMLSLLAEARLTSSPILCTHWSPSMTELENKHQGLFRYVGTMPMEGEYAAREV
jgi:hypothetical protein